MTVELTTESGRVYRLDLEGGFWSRSPYFDPNRIWDMKAGQKLEVPTMENKENWRDGLPNIGEHLYIRGYDEWYVSTKIITIEEKPGWAEVPRIFVYLPTLDTVITMPDNTALVVAEKLGAPIVFYALPSEVGH